MGPLEEPTFTITLMPVTAWFIRNRVTPGPRINYFNSAQGDKFQHIVYDLREKVNRAILRFIDEPDLETIDIDITEDQGWLLDDVIPVDKEEGILYNLLCQVLRGFWSLEMKRLGLSGELANDPRGSWNTKKLKDMGILKPNMFVD